MNKIKQSLLILSLLIPCLATEARTKIPLTEGWMFSKTPATGEARQWNIVNVPHTWNSEDGCTPDYYRGGGRYEYRINRDTIPGDGRLFLRFEGVSQDADVEVNGRQVGNHKGAFTAFCFEITDYLTEGENKITVDVSNAPDPNIAPLEGDFTVFGGIYRPVALISLPSTCISPLDYASSGVYVTPYDISSESAKVKVKAKLDGEELANKNNLSLTVNIIDPYGEVIESKTFKCDKLKTSKAEIEGKFKIKNPVLWSDKNPALYTVKAELLNGKTSKDVVEEKFGLRNVSIDPRSGFYLNGEKHRLKGVNRHQDRKGKGWAISNKDHDEDMSMIKAMGANAIRLAHYPHSSYFYDLCDKEGMLVWAEVPFVGHGTESREFSDNISEQLRELIHQNYNRPSIFCWGLFNEIGNENMTPVVELLNSIAHEEDPSRFTVAATNQDNKSFNNVPDFIAYNTYPGWYWADPSTMGAAIDWKSNERGVGISEYGAGGSVKCHDQNISSAPKTDGSYHPEEWQSKVHEGNYAEIKKHPHVWGTFVWNMFDFASGGRKEGDTNGMNDKGLVTYDRKTPKDAYYFYQAEWSDTPVMHITSKRHEIREEDTTPVKIYTNCKNPLLMVNGEILGSPDSFDGVVAQWNSIALQQGENLVEVTGEYEDKKISDNCRWIKK